MFKGWRIMPKVTYTNYRKKFTNVGDGAFNQVFNIKRFWSGKIISLLIYHHELSFDFRENWR